MKLCVALMALFFLVIIIPISTDNYTLFIICVENSPLFNLMKGLVVMRAIMGVSYHDDVMVLEFRVTSHFLNGHV